jgi:ABC-2 type transport system ATP-binding protein
MESVISAQDVHKNYGKKVALQDINLAIPTGRIVGLIGPNGAGKTTLIKGILGLQSLPGTLQILGKNPIKERIALLEEISFIADTNTLPDWLSVAQAITYVEGVHPKFSREKAEIFLTKTNIQTNSKIKTLSKGMITQLHLALVMAIDSKLLVLDEPTLGLDIMYRKQFYESLISDYYTPQKTILITTHQVEEIEGILTDLLFIDQGKIILETAMADLPKRFVQIDITTDKKALALALNPLHIHNIVGGYGVIFDTLNHAPLMELGSLRTPSVADLFVAIVTNEKNKSLTAVA